MRFKLDENLPNSLVEFLAQHGHDVHNVFDEFLNGAPDSKIAEACRDEQRVLMTLDLDFSDIRMFPPHEFPGIILLRPRLQSERQILYLVNIVLHALHTESVDGLLWVVEPSGIRIR